MVVMAMSAGVKPNQSNSDPANHRDHFTPAYLMVNAGFKQNGSRNVQEYTDYNAHDLVKVSLYTADASVTDSITYIKTQRCHNGKYTDVKYDIAAVEFTLQKYTCQGKSCRNVMQGNAINECIVLIFCQRHTF